MKINIKYFHIPVIFFSLIFASIAMPQNLGKNAISYNKEGWEYLAKGDNFRAILSFKNALKQNPRYRQSLLGLGKAYIKTEAFEESLKLLSEVLKLDKNNVEAINGLGVTMTELGRYNDALKYFDSSLKLSEDNEDAKYGIAYIYFLMDKTIWAKRKLNNILTVNPFHYNSLLLMGDIKTREKRDSEASEFIQKAIDANPKLPDGYNKYGQILLRNYKETMDTDYMSEAIEKFEKALAIHPENLAANRSMGNLHLIRKNYDEALRYFKKISTDYPENSISLYDMAISYAGMNDNAAAVNHFLKAVKLSPSDSILRSRLEDFLVLNEFAEGNPLRVKFSEEHYKSALKKLKTNLSDDAIMLFKRSILLNPLNRQARENLRDMYQSMNYSELYINEQKTLYNLYPENTYQDMLKVALIKRRDRVFYRAGYSNEIPPRDVPKVLVLNLSSIEPVSLHPDAGEIISNYITFTLAQLGRMEPFSVSKRLEISGKLKNDRKFLGDNLETISDMVKKEEIDKPDFIIFGSYREGLNFITIDYELMDYSTGVIINNFSLSETGKDNLPNIALRASKRLYDAIPYKGRVLQSDDEEGITFNMGLIDGIKPGDFVVIYKINNFQDRDSMKLKKKIVLQVTDADGMVSSAKPKIAGDMELIDVNDFVYPYQKRRSRLIK